ILWTASLRSAQKKTPVGAHSICARGSMLRRERARADMESAPTKFVFAHKGKNSTIFIISYLFVII
uniref:hypothetical protein n=1 Tax=Gemmiger formicilis TaxID=745368 RepID=UPI003FEF88C3